MGILGERIAIDELLGVFLGYCNEQSIIIMTYGAIARLIGSFALTYIKSKRQTKKDRDRED
jgi:ABC-type Mn2+/Zn2+ transport system permease subunit